MDTSGKGYNPELSPSEVAIFLRNPGTRAIYRSRMIEELRRALSPVDAKKVADTYIDELLRHNGRK